MTENPDSNNSNEISKETSARICTHMNEDHAVSVYAMAKSLLASSSSNNTKLSNVKLVSVTLEGCQMSAVTCQGDQCHVHKLFYPFQPPLQNSSQVRPAMVQIHHRVCAPHVSWLVTRITPLLVLVAVGLLGYLTHGVGTERFTEMLQDSHSVFPMRPTVAHYVNAAVRYSWYVALVLHGVEALFVVYQAQTTLKLQVTPTLLWFLMVGGVGFPVTKEFLDLLRVHHGAKKEKK